MRYEYQGKILIRTRSESFDGAAVSSGTELKLLYELMFVTFYDANWDGKRDGARYVASHTAVSHHTSKYFNSWTSSVNAV